MKIPSPSFSAAERERSTVCVLLFLSLTLSFDESLCRNGFIFALVLDDDPAAVSGEASEDSSAIIFLEVPRVEEAARLRFCIRDVEDDDDVDDCCPAVLAAASAPLLGDDLIFASRGRGDMDDVGWYCQIFPRSS